MITLHSPYDAQVALRDYLKGCRKQKRLSVRELSELTSVPVSTIRKFESTGEISFRQFLLLYSQLSTVEELINLTEKDEVPESLNDLLMR